MAKLIVSLNGTLVGQHFIDKERMTIGRRAENDVRLDDPGVSKEHVAVETIGNDQILEDLGSTNGTVVNGVRVDGRHILQHGDVIEVGGFHIKYVNQKASSELDLDKTMIISGLDWGDREQVADTAPQAVTARAARNNFPLGGVKGLAGAQAGRRVELPRALTPFGEEGLALAVIRRRPHGYYLLPVSGAAPKVNGVAVREGAQPLAHGDVVEVGLERLEFFLND